ncbi:DUF1634 domain-containing protein [Kamptonema cortianum]|uniref:DUF1634 domain-containing protein n=1 Tax=Geitlerinema calcuttense NRMC-F 0142 TaxID=2922238 RepID=A0ABT7LVR0_9CYAN|nr:DUF1634 domain-containing protein [Geitlerinema calcuttense]MDI9638367.1 DUF1634 domain-containing protein [Geitlerinema splendidum]MDK3155790.1 DUF1634 domain-containing protein [Kamptonema cortianum]MDL5045642.1 DUF1634 domain-containing protein [Oscillatoria amoena NRMC-F 0135]MDL5056123.1 DUF1634 domain-containing protein [Geitlerinema calcuttense NRMC-F 0142]
MPQLEPEVQSLSIAIEHISGEAVDLSEHCANALHNEQTPDDRLGRLLSELLRGGVWMATITVLLGGGLYLMHYGAEPVNYHIFRGEPVMFCSPVGIVRGVLSGNRLGIIQLGLLFLMATPVLRVLVAFIFFIKQQDLIYSLLTGFVICGLLYSLLGAYF